MARCLTAATIAALALLAPAEPVLARVAPPAAREACPFLANLDPARYRPNPRDIADGEAEARKLLGRTRLNLKAPNGYNAGRIIVVQQQGRGGPAYATVAFRSAAGGWWIRTVWPRFAWRSGRALPAPLAARLNAAIASPCLASDPPVATRGWPTLDGNLTICADGSDSWYALDLPPALPSRRFHACSPRGVVADVQAVLEEAIFGPAD